MNRWNWDDGSTGPVPMAHTEIIAMWDDYTLTEGKPTVAIDQEWWDTYNEDLA